jgi:hypothetical protein
MATDSEIQRWTAAVQMHLPEGEVKGVLREAKGLLVQVRRQAISAEDMERYEGLLRRAGATGWSWSVGPGGASMRVRFGGTRGYKWMGVMAVLIAAAVWVYSQ